MKKSKNEIRLEVLSGSERAEFKSFQALDSSSVLETLLKCEVDISHSCGGMGTCGTCRIEVLSALDSLEERNEIEVEMASAREFRPSERLACQLTVCHGLKIKIPDEQ